MSTVRLLQILLACVWLAAVVGCGQTTAADQPTSQEQTFRGRVEASRKAELAFQVSGLIVSLPVKEGQRVARGEVIARLRSTDFEARFKGLQGQLDQARAQLKALEQGERPEEKRRLQLQVKTQEIKRRNAQLECERMDQLIDMCRLIDGTKVHAISQSDYQVCRSRCEIEQNELDAALEAVNRAHTARAEDIEAKQAEIRIIEARLGEAQIQLDDTTLRAPFDGVIARRLVEENQNVWAHYPILKFQDIDRVVIACDVPEHLMAAIARSGQLAQMIVELTSAPGREFTAGFWEAAQEADPATQTYKLRLVMQTPPDDVRLLPGMSCTVRAEGSPRKPSAEPLPSGEARAQMTKSAVTRGG